MDGWTDGRLDQETPPATTHVINISCGSSHATMSCSVYKVGTYVWLFDLYMVWTLMFCTFTPCRAKINSPARFYQRKKNSPEEFGMGWGFGVHHTTPHTHIWSTVPQQYSRRSDRGVVGVRKIHAQHTWVKRTRHAFYALLRTLRGVKWRGKKEKKRNTSSPPKSHWCDEN